MTKYMIFETYDGFLKIAELESEVRYKRYGFIKIKKDLECNVWYDLDYNIIAEPYNEDASKITNKGDSYDMGIDEPECNKKHKTDSNTIECNSTDKKRNEKTIEKLAIKKNKRKVKCFRIRSINPVMLHKIYSLKCNKQINYITNSCLALLQFYSTENTLVFDRIKGLLIYTLLYKVDSITIHRKDKQQCFDTLKYLEKKEVEFIEDECDKMYDTVIVAGEYDNFMSKYKKNIKNIVLFYIKYKEEAGKLFNELLNDKDFIDVSIFDFFTREWQIYENVRPQMNCDLRCGFIVRAVRIRRNENKQKNMKVLKYL